MDSEYAAVPRNHPRKPMSETIANENYETGDSTSPGSVGSVKQLVAKYSGINASTSHGALSLSPRSSSGSVREKNRSNYSFSGRPYVETNLDSLISQEIMSMTTPEKVPPEREGLENRRSIDTIEEHTGEEPLKPRALSFRSDFHKGSLQDQFNIPRREPHSYGEARSKNDYPSFISSSSVTESASGFTNKSQITSQVSSSDRPLSAYVFKLNLIKKIVEVLKFLRDSNLLTAQDDKSSLGSSSVESQLNGMTTAALEFYLGHHGTLSGAVSREELERPARPSSFTEISGARNASLDPSTTDGGTELSSSCDNDEYKRQYLAYLKYLVKYTNFNVSAFDKHPKAWLERLFENRDGLERKEVGDYVNAHRLQPAIDAAWDRERGTKLKRTGSYSKFSLAMHKLGHKVLHVGDYRRRCDLWHSMSKDIYPRLQQNTAPRGGYAVHPCAALLDVTEGGTAGAGVLKKEPVWDMEAWSAKSVLMRSLIAEANEYVLAMQPSLANRKATKFGDMVDAVELLNKTVFPNDQHSAMNFTGEIQHFAEMAYEFWTSGEGVDDTKQEGVNNNVVGDGSKKEKSVVSIHSEKGSMTHQSMETSKHDMETKGDSLKRGTQWLGRALTLNANMEGKMKEETSPGRKDRSLPRDISGLLQQIRQFSFHRTTPGSSGKKKKGSASKLVACRESNENLNATFIVSSASPVTSKATPMSTVEVENLDESVTVTKTSTTEYFAKTSEEPVISTTQTTTITGVPVQQRIGSSDTANSNVMFISSVPAEVRDYYADMPGTSSLSASPIASGGTTIYSSYHTQSNKQSVSPGLSAKRKSQAESLSKNSEASPTYLRGVASDQHVPGFFPLSLPQEEEIQETPETHGDQVRSIGDGVSMSDKMKQGLSSSPDEALMEEQPDHVPLDFGQIKADVAGVHAFR